ncbi:MAG: hypothetical protein ACYTDW_03575 [Planctomycetota bacterium]
MKTKLFFINNLEKRKAKRWQVLEDEINTWMTENRNIKVVDIKQSSSGGSFSPSSVCISLWYEET